MDLWGGGGGGVAYIYIYVHVWWTLQCADLRVMQDFVHQQLRKAKAGDRKVILQIGFKHKVAIISARPRQLRLRGTSTVQGPQPPECVEMALWEVIAQGRYIANRWCHKQQEAMKDYMVLNTWFCLGFPYSQVKLVVLIYLAHKACLHSWAF